MNISHIIGGSLNLDLLISVVHAITQNNAVRVLLGDWAPLDFDAVGSSAKECYRLRSTTGN